MAITYIVEPKLIAPTGLSLTNPITVVAKKDPSDTDTFAELKLYDRNNVLFATLRSSFIIDNFGNHIAVFEISEILKSVFAKNGEDAILAPPYASVPFFSTFILDYDSQYNFSKYYTEILTDKKTHYCVDAGLENYDVYYVFSPDAIRNYQSDFFVYTIFPDDINIPIVFAVDFDETDFDDTDFN